MVEMYKTDDGMIFDSLSEAEEHEKSIAKEKIDEEQSIKILENLMNKTRELETLADEYSAKVDELEDQIYSLVVEMCELGNKYEICAEKLLDFFEEE